MLVENHGWTDERVVVELEAGRALRGKRVRGTLGRRVEWFVVYRHARL